MRVDVKAFDPALFETHTAVLGQTGSGKTNTAKVIVEDLFAFNRRVCVLDPIKSDWWGLKAGADGKSAGLHFVIVGGPRADLPLPASSGAAIGRMVAAGTLPHVIIDMSELRPHESGRWYADFAEALFRHNSGPMHLVLEEADFFAPKEKSGDGEESMRVHWSSRLARAGRSKGIRLVVSCQRTQKLHNDVLGSCEVLVAHRLVFPADQKPVLDWLKSAATKEVTQQISESLAKLVTGECWLYAPERGVLRRQGVRKIKTFDNSKTPAAGDEAHRVQTVAVDVAAIKAELGDAIAEAEANDPAKLRERIGELEEKLAAAGKRAPTPQVDTDQIRREANADARAEMASIVVGRARHVGELLATATTHLNQHISFLERMRVESSGVVNVNGVRMSEMTLRMAEIDTTTYHSPSAGETRTDQGVAEPQKHEENGSLAAATRAVGGQQRGGGAGNRASATAANGKRSAAERVLDALLWWDAIGWNQPLRDMVAYVAGYSPKSSGFEKTLSNLRTAGLIEFPNPGRVEITNKGSDIAASPADGTVNAGQLQRRVRDALSSEAMWRVLEVLTNRMGKPITREDLATQSAYSDRSSGYEKTLSNLRSLGLITYPEKGKVAAVKWLWLEDGQ